MFFIIVFSFTPRTTSGVSFCWFCPPHIHHRNSSDNAYPLLFFGPTLAPTFLHPDSPYPFTRLSRRFSYSFQRVHTIPATFFLVFPGVHHRRPAQLSKRFPLAFNLDAPSRRLVRPSTSRSELSFAGLWITGQRVVRSDTNSRTTTTIPVDCTTSWATWSNGGRTKATRNTRRGPNAWRTITATSESSTTVELCVLSLLYCWI